jgi:16S rRNA (guanine966-N2)-methyltransferase
MSGRGVRIIAGRARGRRLAVPPGAVRPTKDMVREAVFSALSARNAIVDASVLDLYAGSGAYGIEAISRGAARALFVESERAAAATIEQNLATVGFDADGRVVHSRVGTFVGGPLPASGPVDLVFADPPYDVADDEVVALLGALTTPGWLAPDAVVVLERPTGAAIEPPTGLRATWERTFGDTLVLFLRS